MRSLLKDCRGGGPIEYSLVIGIAALIALALFSSVGPRLAEMFSTVNSSLASA